MWRDEAREIDPRSVDRGRGVSRADGRDRAQDPRDVFTRDLDVPRGRERQRIGVGREVVELRASEVRTLATVGTFRVVPAGHLRDADGRRLDPTVGDLRHLRESGLVRTHSYMVGRTRTHVITLTDRGKDVLESLRRSTGRSQSQRFYGGLSKLRELSHDAMLYRAYERTAERLLQRGARIYRVVLDHELKREHQRFLQAVNRGRPDGDGRPLQDQAEIERWASLHDLPYIDGHVHFPDVRIEYEDRDGRAAVEDVEVETPHYRGAHAAAKARSGFTRYRSAGARLGAGSSRGSAPFDPKHAEELV